jgi:prevent-host-death family protein
MKIASVSETKNNLSALLKLVKHGETVTVTEHHRPIALLQPVRLKDWKNHASLQHLVERGLIQLPQEAPNPEAILSLPLPGKRKGKSLVDVLLEERETGR